MAESSRLTELHAIGERILLLSRDNALPLTPRVYEVLFAYLMRDESDLRDAVAAALAAPHGQREDWINTVHDTYLGNAAVEDGLERMRALLARELAEVSEKVSQGMRGNAQMIRLIQGAMRELAGSITRESVQAVAREISVSGKSQLNETTQLSDRLNRTQFQLTRIQRELAELRESASTDHLTRLANRRQMDERLAQLIAGGHGFSFALIDIDNFKRVNDRFGHAVGDTVLQGLGQFLRDNLKGRDFAARCGGEEFALFLPDTPLEGAESLCTTIRRGFGAIHWVNQQTRQEIGAVTLSTGVTERHPDDTVDSLFRRVDRLLYDAKEAGRNRVVAG